MNKNEKERREFVLNQAEVEPGDTATFAALYSELLEIDEALAMMELAALSDDGRCMISGGEVVELGGTRPNVNTDFCNIPF